jgi:hypothetical protein
LARFQTSVVWASRFIHLVINKSVWSASFCCRISLQNDVMHP